MGPFRREQQFKRAGWRKITTATVAVAQLAFAAHTLIAFDCLPTPPPCQAYWQSPLVFLGTVTHIISTPDNPDGPASKKVRMRIDRGYKGVSEPALTLYDNGRWDGPVIEVGEQYLMYTRRDEDGEIPVRGCTRSRHVKFAREDLEYLEAVSAAPPTSRVYGRVASWPEGPGDMVPLLAATVTLSGPNKTETVKADDRGQYSFDGLSPGKYSVSAKLPGFVMPLHDYGFLSADVVVRGCAVLDVTLNKQWPGVISGRLFRPDGTRAGAGIDLNLLRKDEKFEEYRMEMPSEVVTDEHGEYTFRSVRPGTYKIVLHRCCFPTREAPYLPVYWPTATSEEYASEIVVGLEPAARQYDFQMPPEVKRRTVSGQSLLPDGRPAPDLEIWLRIGDDKHGCCDVAEEVRTAPDGTFSFVIFQGYKYFVEVRWREGGWKSDSIPVSFDDARSQILLWVER